MRPMRPAWRSNHCLVDLAEGPALVFCLRLMAIFGRFAVFFCQFLTKASRIALNISKIDCRSIQIQSSEGSRHMTAPLDVRRKRRSRAVNQQAIPPQPTHRGRLWGIPSPNSLTVSRLGGQSTATPTGLEKPGLHPGLSHSHDLFKHSVAFICGHCTPSAAQHALDCGVPRYPTGAGAIPGSP